MTIQFTSNHFVEMYDPTIEDSYRKQSVIDEQACLIEILDTAGQEEFSALRDQWIRDCQAYLILYSITSQTSFNMVPEIRQQILRVKDVDSVPMIIVGNKVDLEDRREVTTKEAKDLASVYECSFMEASAKTRFNVEEIFTNLVRQLRAQHKKTTKSSNKKSGKRKHSACRLL
eukprot:CAMPEP_0201546048 /NCGR_PEP_ID=MMETSP0173_2-20130828/2448_1 /ASSEMBLY_ACC=CAM_ASM_000268 /TAXON_ID=218659 /ORGANISM="Vexillifera sp., Strain DIVA3 564/2" /LENGTH=172 /DNA_ID=CAMNT_0047954633 /DNA_START=102 /DNA_END=620 /DNA_ORIENTATION=+